MKGGKTKPPAKSPAPHLAHSYMYLQSTYSYMYNLHVRDRGLKIRTKKVFTKTSDPSEGSILSGIHPSQFIAV